MSADYKGYWKLEGFLSSLDLGSCVCNKECQYLFINNRWVKSFDLVSSVLNDRFKYFLGLSGKPGPQSKRKALDESRYDGRSIYPCFVLHLRCPYDQVDILSESDKSIIIFQKEEIVCSLVERIFNILLKDYRGADEGKSLPNQTIQSIAAYPPDVTPFYRVDKSSQRNAAANHHRRSQLPFISTFLGDKYLDVSKDQSGSMKDVDIQQENANMGNLFNEFLYANQSQEVARDESVILQDQLPIALHRISVQRASAARERVIDREMMETGLDSDFEALIPKYVSEYGPSHQSEARFDSFDHVRSSQEDDTIRESPVPSSGPMNSTGSFDNDKCIAKRLIDDLCLPREQSNMTKSCHMSQSDVDISESERITATSNRRSYFDPVAALSSSRGQTLNDEMSPMHANRSTLYDAYQSQCYGNISMEQSSPIQEADAPEFISRTASYGSPNEYDRLSKTINQSIRGKKDTVPNLDEMHLRPMNEQNSFEFMSLNPATRSSGSSRQSPQNYNELIEAIETKSNYFPESARVIDEAQNVVHSLFSNAQGSSGDVGISKYDIDVPIRDVITKEMLTRSRVIGQVDNKFINIITHCGKILVVDQHAADERVLFEKLHQSCEPSMLSKKQVRFVLGVQEVEDIYTLENYSDLFKRWGFVYHFIPCGNAVGSNRYTRKRKFHCDSYRMNDSLSTIMLTQVPIVLSECLTDQDFMEFVRYVSQNSDLPSALLEPPIVARIVASKACRSSLKFGEPLTDDECDNLLKLLANTKMPFTCAHGRPTVIPLCSIRSG